MFCITENELINRMKCKYTDEFGNEAVFVRLPERNKMKITFSHPEFKITFDKIVIDTNDMTGCNFNYHFDKEDERITEEYLNQTVENVTKLLNHIVALEGAIKLLTVDDKILAGYVSGGDKSSHIDKESLAKGKLMLLSQYEELAELFSKL